MPALLRKASAGTAAGYGPDGPWTFSWPEDGALVEVPDYVLAELSHHDGFTVVDVPDEPEPEAEPASPAQADEPDPEPAEEATPVIEPAADADFSEVAPPEPVAEVPKPTTGRRSK